MQCFRRSVTHSRQIYRDVKLCLCSRARTLAWRVSCTFQADSYAKHFLKRKRTHLMVGKFAHVCWFASTLTLADVPDTGSSAVSDSFFFFSDPKMKEPESLSSQTPPQPLFLLTTVMFQTINYIYFFISLYLTGHFHSPGPLGVHYFHPPLNPPRHTHPPRCIIGRTVNGWHAIPTGSRVMKLLFWNAAVIKLPFLPPGLT